MIALTSKKLIISTIALSLILGGSSLYAAKSPVQASETDGTHQDNAKHKQHKVKASFPILEETAAILGTDKAALKKSLKEGKSLAEIAQVKGISEAELTEKLLQLRSGKIDQAVKDGRLDADKAGKMKQRMAEHLKIMLNEKNLLDKHDRHEIHKKDAHMDRRLDRDKLAKALGISKDELNEQLKAGKSLAEIAEARGIAKDQLVEKIKEQLTPSIEKWVDRKKGDTHKE